jgi:hypothetical protein
MAVLATAIRACRRKSTSISIRRTGEPLFFNCHISASPSSDVLYPGLGDPLPPDNYAPPLFDMSSELPESMRSFAIQKGIKPNMKPGDRGFVFNADVSGIIDMITIASVAATMPQVDPTR